MFAGGPAGRLVLHVDREAVGELGAIVGEDGMHQVGEVGQEALEEARGSLAVAPWMDLEIDVAGGAVDRDESVALAPLQGRQMLQVDVDEANSGGLESADCGLGRLRGELVQPMAFEQAPVDRAAGETCR